MFTRCPECQTVHSLNAALLAYGSGIVRCGYCDCNFNALAQLFDHWPDSDTPPARPDAEPPVLEIAGGDLHFPDRKARDSEAADAKNPNRAAWVAVFVLLAVITLSHLAWTFREPLLQGDAATGLLVRLGLKEAPAEQAFRDPSMIHLVSRDMHQHPNRAGTLVLSASFVNRASQDQPYPDISLTLFDAAGQPLGRRSFTPRDYLPDGEAQAMLAPQVHVPILLEFIDPGERAVGFELEFE